MSDQSEGEGWWRASDGKWYPPHLSPGQPANPAHPGTPAPTPDSTPTPAQGEAVPSPLAVPTPDESGKRGVNLGQMAGIVLLVVVVVAGAWFLLRGGDDEGGAATQATGTFEGEELWVADLVGTDPDRDDLLDVDLIPRLIGIGDGVALVEFVDRGDLVVAGIDLETGEVLWDRVRGVDQPGVILGGAAIVDGIAVYLEADGDEPGAPGRLQGVEASSGRRAWDVPGVGAFDQPMVVDGALLVSLRDDTTRRVGSIDVTSGEIRWESNAFALASELAGDFVVAFDFDFAEGGVVLSGVDPGDGATRWRRAEATTEFTRPATSPGADVVVVDLGSALLAVDADVGEELWRTDAPEDARRTMHITDDGALVVCSDDGSVAVHDLETGDRRWGTAFGDNEDGLIGRGPAVLAATPEVVVVASSFTCGAVETARTPVVAYDVVTGAEVWSDDRGGFDVFPAPGLPDQDITRVRRLAVIDPGPDGAEGAMVDVATGEPVFGPLESGDRQQLRLIADGGVVVDLEGPTLEALDGTADIGLPGLPIGPAWFVDGVAYLGLTGGFLVAID